jgi:UDP-glucose 4-epimerase
MKVLVTGGAGYIGTETVRVINEMHPEAEIVIYDNLSRGNYNLFIGRQKLGDKVSLVEADLLDSRTLRKSLDGAEVVIHLAAKVTTPFADQNPHLFEQVNHWGTAELIYAIEESPSVKKLIHVSSGSVYGSSSEEMAVSAQLNPRTFYGISKMRAEEHVQRLMDGGLSSYILRCGNVYGYSKSMRFDSVINKFLFEANYKRRIAINGSGEQHRSFAHIDRVSIVIASLVSSTLKPGVFNLLDKTLSINSVADALKNIYPDLDLIYVNQMLKLRELKMTMSPELNNLASSIKDSSLEEELNTFSVDLTF